MKKRSEATQTLRAGCMADPQTNTQTNRGDDNTLRSIERSVIIDLDDIFLFDNV